jgi:hypothetical protein
MAPLTGGCLCGALKYSTDAEATRTVVLPLRNVPEAHQLGVCDAHGISGGESAELRSSMSGKAARGH